MADASAWWMSQSPAAPGDPGALDPGRPHAQGHVQGHAPDPGNLCPDLTTHLCVVQLTWC